MGRMIMQQFSSKNIAPSSTALLPKAIRLLRHITIRASKTPLTISPLPIMISELYDKVERESFGTKELTLTPFA